MRFIIVGAGAVGSVIGSHLTKAEAQVVLVGDPPHIEKIRRQGLTLTGKYGEFVTHPPVCSSLTEWQYQPDDVVFLAVKTYDTPVALEQISAPVQLFAFTSDWLYPPHYTEEMVKVLESVGKDVEYHLIPSPYGHDAFLLEHETFTPQIRAFLERVTPS